MSEPRTEAGRRLLTATSVGGPSPYGDAILAIEREAASLDVERLARAFEAVYGTRATTKRLRALRRIEIAYRDAE